MTYKIPTIASLADTGLQQRLRHRIDRKTKPLGALGRLESLAQFVGLVQGTEHPALHDPQMIVFAGDHGIAARGVSAYPSDVTWQMVENFLAGGAAVSVLARQHGLALTVVDAGVNHAFAPRPGLLDRKVASGTADMLAGPAMTAEQCAQALQAGGDVVRGLPGNAVLLGEMGIGNTSSASLLLAMLTGEDLGECIGRGTGLDDEGLARKRSLLGQAMETHRAATSPLALMAAVGGFEIAMIAGAALQAAAERRLVVVDGFIAGAAVLWASRLVPALLGSCVWAHSSAEPGHRLMTKHLGVVPLLDLGLRLGEGSGAALAWPLIVSAVRILDEMASFESAGVSDKATN
ncbi:nicotinate-nucleotide--dimethylbenzimidazole phosphoribosyltransferase [Rhizobacter sp. Root1221]|uniref:nicotinate-nucleotide--dimethylbenzimidazole phosphoribosyltransferase n=1 Tax=Rhizobacter sp. Root1221 TaxID=1736433 RepID=UPI0006FF21D3|nr:nicotinate-nucleotide--dimethylbenzimidazole phosphoribosyltransferase [Rhizobacter sp. Root1221]KQV78354.1 nicotinate-nucleotide--dimethylbenzimidazole phosphoribosyltransferase [Rhizobacter sp. Root1221]